MPADDPARYADDAARRGAVAVRHHVACGAARPGLGGWPGRCAGARFPDTPHARASHGRPVRPAHRRITAKLQQFETNVFGLVRMCQLVLLGMRAQHSGIIVDVGSAAGLISAPGSAAYPMTKWSPETLSDTLRYETRGFGVRVVLLEPGGVTSTRFMDTETASWPGSWQPPLPGFWPNATPAGTCPSLGNHYM
jgi:NAD(P)-dependent dehydrogenase (short-subunit alcohol dehydrogenase family)